MFLTKQLEDQRLLLCCFIVNVRQNYKLFVHWYCCISSKKYRTIGEGILSFEEDGSKYFCVCGKAFDWLLSNWFSHRRTIGLEPQRWNFSVETFKLRAQKCRNVCVKPAGKSSLRREHLPLIRITDKLINWNKTVYLRFHVPLGTTKYLFSSISLSCPFLLDWVGPFLSETASAQFIKEKMLRKVFLPAWIDKFFYVCQFQNFLYCLPGLNV